MCDYWQRSEDWSRRTKAWMKSRRQSVGKLQRHCASTSPIIWEPRLPRTAADSLYCLTETGNLQVARDAKYARIARPAIRTFWPSPLKSLSTSRRLGSHSSPDSNFVAVRIVKMRKLALRWIFFGRIGRESFIFHRQQAPFEVFDAKYD